MFWTNLGRNVSNVLPIIKATKVICLGPIFGAKVCNVLPVIGYRECFGPILVYFVMCGLFCHGVYFVISFTMSLILTSSLWPLWPDLVYFTMNHIWSISLAPRVVYFTNEPNLVSFSLSHTHSVLLELDVGIKV